MWKWNVYGWFVAQRLACWVGEQIIAIAATCRQHRWVAMPTHDVSKLSPRKVSNIVILNFCTSNMFSIPIRILLFKKETSIWRRLLVPWTQRSTTKNSWMFPAHLNVSRSNEQTDGNCGRGHRGLGGTCQGFTWRLLKPCRGRCMKIQRWRDAVHMEGL